MAVNNVLSYDVVDRIKKGEKLTIIDVREPYEFTRGHIPGAKLIPLNELPNRLHEVPKNEEVVLACASGGRSAAACEFLSRQGFSQVKNLMGGMSGWTGDVER